MHIFYVLVLKMASKFVRSGCQPVIDVFEEEDDTALLLNNLRHNYNVQIEKEPEFVPLPNLPVLREDDGTAFDESISSVHNDSRSVIGCASCSKSVPVKDTETFMRGQHISFTRLGGIYEHHAIVTSVVRKISTTVVELELIHFKKENKKIKVSRETKMYNLVKEKINVTEYEHCKYTEEEIVQRAENVLQRNARGESPFQSYNILTRNCEHFATWCVVGEGTSLQVETLREKIKTEMCGGQTGFFRGYVGRLLLFSADEIAGAITKSINVTGIVLGCVTALLFLYNIVMSYIYAKDYGNGHMCKSCLKKKLFVIWADFGLYAAASLLQFCIVYFAFPILGSEAIPFIILALLMSACLKWDLSKIYRFLMSPLDALTKTKVERLTELEIGDIISSRYYGIKHDMIITEIHSENDFVGSIRCVHYGLPTMFSTREILEEYFYFNLNKHSLQRYDCRHMLCYSPVAVVHRARKRVGEKKWAISSNRSDHICFWAKEKRNTDDDSKSNVQEVEIHLMDEIQRGDVIHFKKIDGIVTKLSTLDNGKGRSIEIDQIIYDKFWFVRKQTITVCLNTDKLTVKKFRNKRCCQMETRVQRTEKLLNKKGEWWFDEEFIKHCIMN